MSVRSSKRGSDLLLSKEMEVSEVMEKSLSKRLSSKRNSSKRKSTGGRMTRSMSDLGASMYRLGAADPRHDTIINSVLYFEEPVPLESIRDRVKTTMLSHWRFYSTLKKRSDGSVEWKVGKDKDVVDLEHHIREIEIPCQGEVGTQQDLNEFIGSLYGTLMDYSVPVWEVLSITNAKGVGPEGTSNGVVLVRLHHTIGDGISLTAFLMKLFDEKEAEVDAEPEPVSRRKKFMSKVNIWPKVAPWMRQLHSARVFAQGVLEGLLLPVLPGDEDCALRSKDNSNLGPRLVATSPVVPLSKIKDIKNAVGATVNDVLVAALTGVMQRYLESHGERIPQGQVRAACLINMRGKKEMDAILKGEGDLGNKFNFLPIHMPISKEDPLDRLYHCKMGLDDVKQSPAPLLTFKVNQLGARFLPNDVVIQATRDLFQKMTCVFSNVPGPAEPVYFCQQKVDGMNFFANSLTATVFGLISYNDKVQLSAVVDKNVVQDPQALVDLFVEEIDSLYDATRGKFRKPKINAINYAIDGAIVASVLLILLLIVLKLLI